MPNTTLVKRTLRRVLNNALPDNMMDALRKIKLGNRMSIVKLTVTGLTAGASFDITTLAFKAQVLATGGFTGIELGTQEGLPPIAIPLNLRVTAASAGTTVGSYLLGDVGASMVVPPGGASLAVGVARLSDDGKTITLPANVTAFTLAYMPGNASSLDAEFEPSV